MLGLVLRGGESRRMGRDKGKVVARPGMRQVDYLLEILRPFCLKRGVSVGGESKGDALAEGVVEILDSDQASGPMAGILAGLEAGRGWPILVVACDMPYVETDHVLQLVNRRDPERLGTCFLGTDGRPEPLFAIYEPAALPLLQERAKEKRFGLRAFVERESFEVIEPASRDFLVSVNDPESLVIARKKLGEFGDDTA